MDINKLKHVFEKIAIDEAVINPEIEFEDCTIKGDGYMGDLKTVTITGSNKSLDLIVKTAPQSIELRKQTGVNEAYVNEITFYTETYPGFQQFQELHQVETPFNSVAKCFKTNSDQFNEMLIFENLKTQGFQMWDRKQPMNEEHVTLVLKEYAKFHAVSLALKHQKPEEFAKITANYIDIFQTFYDDKIKVMGFKRICDKFKVKVADTLNDKNIDNVFEKLCDDAVDTLRNITLNIDQYSVLIHGDCWCNNMMFKYEGESTKNPSSMKLIDWQLSKLSTPIADLSYFIYVCGSKEIFKKLDYFLHIYHDTLSEQLIKMGTDPLIALPFSVLKQQWKDYGRFGLIMSFITLKIMLCDSDECPDFSKSAEDGDFMDALDYESKNDAEYQRRLNDIILHCYNNEFI